jgi:uncharacterized membrane protein YbhN (UPF0104 family)
VLPVKGNWNRDPKQAFLWLPSEEPLMPETYDAHKSTTEVRQANRRQMNLRVLVISIVLVVVAFAAIYVFFFAMPPSNTVTPYTP